MVFVSVIIPVYKDAVRLRLCLKALAVQTYPPDAFEIIVADNGSPEDTKSALTDFPAVRFVTEPAGGSYAARNAAIAIARGPVLAFTDADCVPDPEWITAGAAAISADTGLGFVAGRVQIVAQVPDRPNIWEALDSVSALPQHEFVASGFGATANLFTRVDVMAAVGTFRSDMFSSGDLEWGRRSVAKGFRAAYSAEAFVLHPARSGFFQFSRQIRRLHHGFRSRGHRDTWRDIVRGHGGALRVPKRIRRRTDLSFGLKWRVLLAAAILKTLERWIRVLVLVFGRPTLFPRSIKGW